MLTFDLVGGSTAEPPVHPFLWALLGAILAILIMLPVVRLLLRQGERRARAAERRAHEAERLAELGSMTGGLAHEIKNPLSTIGLNAQLLAEGLADSALPQDQKERLGRRLDSLKREAERLRDILTDFLQFAGRFKLDPQPKDVVAICDELSDFFLPQCDRAGVLLRTQMPPHAVMAKVDEGLFKQALLNLMLNAVQAMSRAAPADRDPRARIGELMIRVEPQESEVLIHVIDTGPGIERERQEAIFRPYVTGRAGGTGLGLPIARRIAEEHGGRLTVQSEPGRGSDFCLRLPRLQTASPI